MTPTEFLIELWGDPPPGQVLIWTLPDKRSTWFSDFSDFNNVDAFVAEQVAQGKDVYTGVSIAPVTAEFHFYARIANSQSGGIAGLWADIDIAGPSHQKQNLPPNVYAALEALKGVGYEPSITIHSGHGLQCWWLFVRPWLFQDAHELKLAQEQTQAWHDLIAREFKKYGFTLDATHDLARVMRLPGTMNNKDAPVPVRTLFTSDFRWRDLPELRPSASQNWNPGAFPAKVGELHLSPDLKPDRARLNYLLAEDHLFRKSWHMERTDFSDQSASAYDMSIASRAALIGCSDQEILALLITRRRLNGQDLKLNRLDYYQRTIGKAKAGLI